MKKPIKIKMSFFESDEEPLYYLMQKCKSSEFCKHYRRALEDFAIDLRYADYIQEDLLEYLLPYYHTTIKEYSRPKNLANCDAEIILEQFFDALIINSNKIINAMGANNYRKLMDACIDALFEHMENDGFNSINWIFFFNTIIYLDKTNARIIFDKIWHDSSDKVKISFFLYLSVFFFEEKDNIFNKKLKNSYQSGHTWGVFTFGENYNWDEFTINNFRNEMTNSLIISEFLGKMESILLSEIDDDDIKLVLSEMKGNFNTVYKQRINEFADKMLGNGYLYWEYLY